MKAVFNTKLANFYFRCFWVKVAFTYKFHINYTNMFGFHVDIGGTKTTGYVGAGIVIVGVRTSFELSANVYFDNPYAQIDRKK